MTTVTLDSVLEAALALHMSGRLAEAEPVYRQLAVAQPGDPRPWHFLGVLLGQTHRPDEAERALTKAIELAPDDAEALTNLANVVRSQGRYRDSAELCRRAIALNPSLAAAYVNLSAAVRMTLGIEEAISAAEEAIRLAPGLDQGHCNLGHALLFAGRAEEAVGAFQQALAGSPHREDIHQNLLFSLQYSDRAPAAAIADETRRYGRRYRPVPRQVPNRPLRTIGFVSGDFRRHPVGLVVTPLLERLRDRGFRLVAFSQVLEEDGWTARTKAAVHEFHRLRDLDPASSVNVVRGAAVDLMIDLAGHSADNRMDVMALGAAPVQATWLGYSGSTGLPTIDWLIGDPHVTPATEEAHLTERVVRLRDAFLATDPNYIEGGPTPLPALEPSAAVTFASFNNIVKASDSCLRAWVAVLEAVPNARFLMKGQHFCDPSVLSHFRDRFRAAGADLSRVELRAGEPLDRHWASFGEVDVMLDTFPYTGATTTVEALALGVPVVTMRGDRYVGHMSESLLATVGRSEWVADSVEQYAAIASGLVADLPALAETRAALRPETLASPLCDLDRFADSFVMACEHVWASSQTAPNPETRSPQTL